jgi:hypothetical protein
MADLTLQTLPINGIQMRVAGRATDPLVLLCHRFPEGWVSWRSQLAALATGAFVNRAGNRVPYRHKQGSSFANRFRFFIVADGDARAMSLRNDKLL